METLKILSPTGGGSLEGIEQAQKNWFRVEEESGRRLARRIGFAKWVAWICGSIILLGGLWVFSSRDVAGRYFSAVTRNSTTEPFGELRDPFLDSLPPLYKGLLLAFALLVGVGIGAILVAIDRRALTHLVKAKGSSSRHAQKRTVTLSSENQETQIIPAPDTKISLPYPFQKGIPIQIQSPRTKVRGLFLSSHLAQQTKYVFPYATGVTPNAKIQTSEIFLKGVAMGLGIKNAVSSDTTVSANTLDKG